MKTLILLTALVLCGCFLAQSAPAPQSIPPVSTNMFVQSKACGDLRDPDGHIASCTFDKPVTAGDLWVIQHYGGGFPNDTGYPKDNQGNVWQSVWVSNFHYTTIGKSGVATVDLHGENLGGAYFALMVEYKPVLGIDTHTDPNTGATVPSVTWGTYNGQNLESPQGSSWDHGWTPPVYTDNSCDLLIAWSFAGSYETYALHPDHFPTAGPGFTVRESEYGDLAIEDSIAVQPGIHITSIQWNTPAHWEMGSTLFRTGMTSCGN